MYFKSKGFGISDPIQNQYGPFSILVSSQGITRTGRAFWRMSTSQTFYFSILGSGSTRKKLTALGRSYFRTRRPASLRPCWFKISTNLAGTSSMRRRLQETKQRNSVPCWVTKGRSEPSSPDASHMPPIYGLTCWIVTMFRCSHLSGTKRGSRRCSRCSLKGTVETWSR